MKRFGLRFLGFTHWPFVNTLITGLLGLAVFVDRYDFDKSRQEYPDWKGFWDLVESLPGPFAILGLLVATFLTSLLVGQNLRLREKRVQSQESALSNSSQLSDVCRTLLDTFLRDIGGQLSFSQTGNTRVSLYIYDSTRSKLFAAGRFSWNPELIKKGRTSFPLDQGCIGRAWREDWHFNNSFPDDPREALEVRASQYSMTRNIGKNLTMSPLLIAAKRLSKSNGEHYGVVVVESKDRSRYTEDDLKANMKAIEERIGPLLVTLLPYVPNPLDAEDAGL